MLRTLGWLSLSILGCGPPPALCPCAANAPPKRAPACPSPAPSAPPSLSTDSLTCGQLALREARLVSLGKGDNHPTLLAVREQLAKCTDRKPTKEECRAVAAARVKLEEDYGAKHPERIANDAEHAVCAAAGLL
jgi:hypothetical protein